MSRFQIMSRKQCEDFCNSNILEPSFVIISISTPNDIPYANFYNIALQDILYLHFADFDDNKPDCITNIQADLIYNFAYYYFNSTNYNIIIHCDAGISRSAGVCAALMKIFENNDEDIFNSHKYYPNMLCYRKVLESHFGTKKHSI